MTPEIHYYISDGGQEQGPFIKSQLRSMWDKGALSAEAFYWREGMMKWEKISLWAARSQPPQPAKAEFLVLPSQSAKSRGIYIILGLFFGGFGVHNFYAGYYASGALQALILCSFLGWTTAAPSLDISTDAAAVMLIGGTIMLIYLGGWIIVDLCSTTKDASGTPFNT